MAAYADSIQKAPRTLTEREQKLLLKVTGEHRSGFRDHVIIATALGTGLRAHELLALEVGDVFDGDGRARRRVLNAAQKSPPDRGEVLHRGEGVVEGDDGIVPHDEVAGGQRSWGGGGGAGHRARRDRCWDACQVRSKRSRLMRVGNGSV